MTGEQTVPARTAEDAAARLWIGALAGLLATAAMTAVMRRGREGLPTSQRYSLPPTELVQAVSRDADPRRLGDKALVAHFAYGAFCGGVLAVIRWPATNVGSGIAGLAIWAVSYLGWAPALGLLRPATSHPWRRNVLMLASHLAWGLGFRMAVAELKTARQAFAARAAPLDGPSKEPA